MRAEPSTMIKQPKHEYTPNRHERRAEIARKRPMTKKLKKYNQALKKALAKSGNPLPENLNDVPVWDEEEVKEFKAS